ncbi:MAG TPA: hypothetical protein VHW47_02855 [Acidimicrobiales bacterium]|nr:hypothetical protein [Acidimicrobiales bacterium]
MAEPVADGPGGLRLEQAASLVGAYRWAEHRLFELTGAWAAEPAPPGVQVHLDEVSAQHGWHAQLWADRLPVLDWFDPATVTLPAGPAAGPLLEALAALPADPVDRLAGLYRVVVPRLLVGYDRHLARAVPVADAPVIRALRLVRRDEVASWRAGEALLQGLLGEAGRAAAAARVQRDLEAPMAAQRIGPGLFPWPEPMDEVPG